MRRVNHFCLRIGATSPPVLGSGLSLPLRRAVIAVPGGRKRCQILRLVRGASGTGITIGKDRQLLLRRANSGQQRHRIKRGELLAQTLLDRFIDAVAGEQPLIRRERRMVAFTHQRAVALFARQLE